MSQKISKEDVEHIARLTRLHLSSEEVDKFTDQLGDVLEYVDQLPEEDGRVKSYELKVKGGELREDEVMSDDIGKERLLENVPQTDGTSIRVPAVLGGDDE